MTKAEKAVKLFNSGILCAPAVFAVFAEEYGIPEETALKTATPFGSGMRKAEVCGACTGALLALGAKFGQKNSEDVESRIKSNKMTEKFLEEFARVNGSYLCRNLLKCDISTTEGAAYAKENNLFTTVCPKMVESATAIVEQLLNEN